MGKVMVERATRLGRVRGVERMGVETYWGLRYAEPARRFQASVLNATSWNDVYDATSPKAMALQPDPMPELYGPTPGGGFDEDCLFLNIHAPKTPSDVPRPVIFFVHGGSFTSGGANFYDGTALAIGADAVVVCINYRLGVFAALDLEWLGTERDGGGQLWLGDQINALRWVRDNIVDYGGDPGMVTVIGESAGALSVAALCAAPSAVGLVHRAVACSTAYLVDEPSNDVVKVFAKSRGVSREAAVEYMKTAPAADLLALAKRGKQISPTPVANTPLLPGRMEDLIRARGANAVPMIAGYAMHEGLSLFLTVKHLTGLPGPLLNIITNYASRGIAMHPARGKAKVKAYLQRLKKAIGTRFTFGERFDDAIWTDGFRRGAVDYAEWTSGVGSRGYVYSMDVPMRFAGKMIPASHGIDLALTFNVGDDPQHTVPAFAEHPQANELARRWVRMLGHFARHGEPGDALGEWPVYEPRQRASMRVSCDGCHVQPDAEKLFRENVWVRTEMTFRSWLSEVLMKNLWVATRTQIADSVVPGSGGIVFLGDSITHLGKWDLIFPQARIRNFGIGGERTSHMLERLEPLLALKPEKVFILIGSNDLGVGLPVEDAAANMEKLLDRLRAELPGCPIYLQSVMPRSKKLSQGIQALNLRYRAIAAARGVTWIDLFPPLVGGAGELKAEYTEDGIHLNGAGYLVWRELLRSYVESRV